MAAAQDPKTTGQPVLRCTELVVGWRGQALLPAIDLELRRGELVAVVGRNGAGKSTWLKTLLGLIPPVAGQVRPLVPDLRRTYVPQSAGLDVLWPLRAIDVVRQGRLRGWNFMRPIPSAADRRACDSALAEAEATPLSSRPFRDLSKGEQQRVLFARMLTTRADLALLDEPTAAMDKQAEQGAIRRLARVARERAMAIVVVSHAPEVATDHADRILLLDPNQQRVLWGTRQEVSRDDFFGRQAITDTQEAEDG
jgi:zinc transport system ATP-binding protein